MANRRTRFLGPASSLRSQLLRGGVGSVGIKSAYILIQFAVAVALARTLGPKALGIYAFMLALVQLISIVAEFGFPTYLIRAISLYRAGGAAANAVAVIKSSLQSVFLLSVLCTLLAIAAVFFVPGLNPLDISRTTIVLGSSLIPLISLIATSSGAIRGLGSVVAAQLPDQIIRPAGLLIALVVPMVGAFEITLNGVLCAQLVAALLALLTALRIVRRHSSSPVFDFTPGVQHLALLRRSMPFLLLASAQVLNYQTAVIVLGVLATQEEVGLYRVVLQLSDALGVALYAISVVIAPHLARLHGKNDWVRINKILVQSHRAAALALLLFATPIAFFGPALLSTLFGHEYVLGADALPVLVFGKAVYATVAFAGLALSMLGAVRLAALNTLAAATINVALGVVLIPRYGIEGAAIAGATSQLLTAIAGICYMHRRFGYDFSALGWRRA